MARRSFLDVEAVDVGHDHIDVRFGQRESGHPIVRGVNSARDRLPQSEQPMPPVQISKFRSLAVGAGALCTNRMTNAAVRLSKGSALHDEASAFCRVRVRD